MFKKIGIILFFTMVVGARHAVPLHAQTQQTECPPECTIDTMEIVTWYPSPYNEYEELRLYPKTDAEESLCDSSEKLGLMYYNKSQQALKVCWQSPDTLAYSWEKIALGQGGYWELSGDDISNTNSGKVTINGNMQADDIYLTTLGKWLSQVVPVNLVNTVHTSAQCYDLGGTLIDDGTGKKMCKFSGSSCPTGWSQYQNWCATSESNVRYEALDTSGDIKTYNICDTRHQKICVSSSHQFSNLGPQSKTCYGGYGCGAYNSINGTYDWTLSCSNAPIVCYSQNATATETIIEIGCY